MRLLLASLAFLISLAVTAAVVIVAIFFLAGPHGGLLPMSFHSAALLLGWLVVLGVPLFVTKWVWRRQFRGRN
jgi:hypothetical protein